VKVYHLSQFAGLDKIKFSVMVFFQFIVSSQVNPTFVSSVAFILSQAVQVVHQLVVVLT